jgi:hypothetical protein
MEQQLAEMAQRVGRLEREARCYRAVAGLAALLLAGGFSRPVGAAREARPPAEVSAQRFTLVSAAGEPRAVLESAIGAGPRLSLLALDRTPRLVFELAADGTPLLTLNAAGGERRVVLEAAADESRVSVLGMAKTAVTLANGGAAPRVAVADSAGQDRVWLAVRLGSPVLQFLDPKGMARTGLTTFNDDRGLTVISASDSSTPGLVLLGKDRNVVWSAPDGHD